MEVKLQSGEQIVDLERNGYKIIQNRERFCFGMDAVLLTGFAKVGKGERALDLGTGTGIIPILLEAKTEGQDFEALEIQPESAEMARRSVMLNNLQERIKIVDGDIKEASKIFGAASFNVVTTNPPYMTENHGVKNPDEPKAIARHEIKCNLEDVVREASKCLKVKGHMYMVHRPSRLVDIFTSMKNNHLEPKRMRLVYPYVDKPANMVLIEAVKGGNSQLKVEEPLIVYNKDGSYTAELLDMYGMKE